MKAITGDKRLSENPEALLALVTQSLEQDKALEPVVVDLRGKTTIADYMVVATGTSDRHIVTMAEKLRMRLDAAGVRVLSVEGLEEASWVLVDIGDVIVHLFRAERRALYDIERLWSVAAPREREAVRAVG